MNQHGGLQQSLGCSPRGILKFISTEKCHPI
jgi:hypothetical protein